MELDYKKFRWFFTSNGELVIGGKSAEQNEMVIKLAKKDNTLLHTNDPGSPFCILVDNVKENSKDIKEAAIFCASLSQGWKKKKKEIKVNVFKKSQVYKLKGMAKGTFGVNGKEQIIKVLPKLYLTLQYGRLRCVPFKTNIAEIIPGDESKEEIASKITETLKIKKEEVLSALPPNKIKLKWL